MRQAHRVRGASFATRASSKIFKVCCVCCKEFSTDWARSWSFCTKCCEVLTFCSKEVWSSLYLGNLSTWHEMPVKSSWNRTLISEIVWHDLFSQQNVSISAFFWIHRCWCLQMIIQHMHLMIRDAIPKAHKWGSIQWECNWRFVHSRRMLKLSAITPSCTRLERSCWSRAFRCAACAWCMLYWELCAHSCVVCILILAGCKCF